MYKRQGSYCARDFPPPKRCDDWYCKAYYAAAAGVAFVIDLAAVSYTHLRAHETVLDLVCRLLLEKKKTIYFLVLYEI